MICAKCLAGTCLDHSGSFSATYPATETTGGRWASGLSQRPIIIHVEPLEPESATDEQEAEAAIYSALADVILGLGDGRRSPAGRLQARLQRLVQALPPRVQERRARKIAEALQAVPGLLVTLGEW